MAPDPAFTAESAVLESKNAARAKGAFFHRLFD
jgi:hypothetical protein